jgi:hypothetical protein
MTDEKEKAGTQGTEAGTAAGAEGSADECSAIKDPVRRTLCKACGLPVVGEAPFCKDHEPPVP